MTGVETVQDILKRIRTTYSEEKLTNRERSLHLASKLVLTTEQNDADVARVEISLKEHKRQ
jgi:hypothetical protein